MTLLLKLLSKLLQMDSNYRKNYRKNLNRKMDRFLKRKPSTSRHETDSSGNESGDDQGNISIDACKKTKYTRKYDVEYIKYGFVPSENDENLPVCVICLQVLSNEAMKPTKLRRHLTTRHPNVQNKPKEYFERKASGYTKQRAVLKSTVTLNEKSVKASYLIAQRIAKSKKPHTIGEDLIMPTAIEICDVLFGSEYAKKLKSIPISNDTVRRRISEMSEDIVTQLTERLQSTTFAIQLDESTDIAGESQLLAYVRYCWQNVVEEEFLFCKSLPARTTADEIFRVINEFFTNFGLQWTNCIGVCTDGAATMTGRKSGVVTRIKQVSPEIVDTHCMIHREALASKNLNETLGAVLDDCVRIVNFIKTRTVNSRLFAQLCIETDAQHKHLLLHSAIRWLSRGKVLERVFELRLELLQFLTEHNLDLAGKIADTEWLAMLAYLVDIFSLLNSLNTSMQGKDACLLKTHDKVAAFKKKLGLWLTHLESNSHNMFNFFSEFIESNEVNREILERVNDVIKDHISSLATYFDIYFTSQDIEAFDWIRNPFQCVFSELTGRAQDELAELSSDRTLQIKFNDPAVDISSFWCTVSLEYPLLSALAMKVLLPFSTTYLCEVSFSALTAMKTKYRSRMNVEDDLRMCLSKIPARIDILSKRTEHHP